jgi:hypothetical protein
MTVKAKQQPHMPDEEMIAAVDAAILNGSNLPDDPDDDHGEAYEAEQRGLFDAARRKIGAGYEELRNLIGPARAKQEVTGFLKWATPKKPKGPTPRQAFRIMSPTDKAILAAYDRAPARGRGKDLIEVYAVPPAAGTQAREARKKLLKRLLDVRHREHRILDGYREFSKAQNDL